MAPSLTRELVIATARRHLEADGLGRFSLRAVARDLEVTAPALYAYVSSKEELVALVAAAHFEALARRFEEVGDDDPLDRVRALSRAYVDHARSSPKLFALMFRFPPVPVPDADAFPPAARAFDVAARATADAIESGALAVDDATEASLTMWCAVHGVAEVLLMGFATDDAADALVDRVIDTVLAGQAHPLP
ncbi:MAG: TetR/AcrR family transcriptional regulator [Acidimicrobiales bacterium]|nr:TetR/AcrR family transcriptional regulator [Acidimicrobiales bacterium]